MHEIGFDEAIETQKHYKFTSHPQQSDYDDQTYNADYCTAKGIDFIKRSVQEDKPFFLYMPYYLVHAPFHPKKKYVDYFSKKLKGTDYDHKHVIEVVSMLKSLDDSVGELLKALNDLGLEENTLIVFTSDNGHYKVKGNNLFALPYKGNKGDPWEGGIRVPYIFKWKGKIAPNTVSDLPTIHVDLYPHFCRTNGPKNLQRPYTRWKKPKKHFIRHPGNYRRRTSNLVLYELWWIQFCNQTI